MTMPETTQSDLVAKLKALDAEATQGLLEWDAGIIPPDGPDNYADLYVTDVDMEPIILAEFNDNLPEGRGNAKLWCFLRNAVPEIIAMAEDAARLRAHCEALADALGLYTCHPCPICNGDCSSAMPPVLNCPTEAAVKAFRDWDGYRGENANVR